MSSDSRFDYLLRAAELTGSTLSKEQYIDFQSQELDEEQSEALSLIHI